jgi:glycosyltransferase involved in cell wall biosynthesis
MKKINVIVPCYNEENSIKKFYDIIKGMFNNEIKHYDYDIIFVDDRSKDNTRNIIREICEKDKKHVKAVFNVTNF